LYCVGLTIDQVTRWYPSFLHQILGYSVPVSFLARDEASGDLAGVIVNIVIDPALPQPPSMKGFLDPAKEPVTMQIATFLEDLEEGTFAIVHRIADDTFLRFILHFITKKFLTLEVDCVIRFRIGCC